MWKLALFNITFTLFVLCAVANQREQIYDFQYYSTGKGLSNSVVDEIVQDNDGFLWFGTNNGLNRFDGNTFKVFKEQADSTQLRNYFIKKLFVDSHGLLWVGTSERIGIYDKKREAVIDINYYSNNAIDVNQIEDIVETENGDIWFLALSGLYHYERTTNICDKIEFPESANDYIYNMIALEVVNGHDLIIASKNHLLLFKTETRNVTDLQSFTVSDGKTAENADYIEQVLLGKDGTLWVATYYGNLYKSFKNYTSAEVVNVPFTQLFNDIYQETDSTLLIGMDEIGLVRYFIQTDRYEYIYDIDKNRNIVKLNKARSIFIDRQNLLWVGNTFKGLYYVNLRSSGFDVQANYMYDIADVEFPVISAVLKDRKGDFWLGTDGNGLYRFAHDSKKLQKHYYSNPGESNALPNNAVLDLFEDSFGQLWVGTYRGGLSKYIAEIDGFVSYSMDDSVPSAIGSNDIREITEDSGHNLWTVSHGHGISKFNRKTEKFMNYQADFSGSNSILDDWTYDFTFDKTGNLWVATTRGVSKLDTARNWFTNYMYEPENKNSLSHPNLYSAFCDSKGRVWLGSGKGLNRYEPDVDGFIQDSLYQGLNDEIIKSIAEDNEGSLWIGTNNGLFQINMEMSIFRHYKHFEKISSNEFMINSNFKDHEGRLYFGGSNGYICFKPEEIKLNTAPPAVEIISVEVMGETHTGYSSDDYPVLRLAHNQNFLTFHYVALNFIDPGRNTYKYKLEGLDEQWKHVGNEKKASYTSLPPGKYVFHVIAANNDGVWNNAGKQFAFVILPPFWQTWWFRFLAIVFTASIVFAFFYIKMNSIKLQNKVLEEKVKDRTKDLELANQSLIEKHEEVLFQNNLLLEKQGVIENQNAELTAKKTKIQQVNEALKSMNVQLQESKYELLEKNKQLSEHICTKDKMISIIAHDLRNPMNTLIGFSNLLKNRWRVYSEDKIQTQINAINQGALNAGHLLENLLTWARSQTGSILLEKEKTDIADVLQTCIGLSEEDAKKKEINIELILKTENRNAFIDKNTVSTIFRNLISNALKFTPPNGTISVIAEEADEFLIVNVCDTGVGMTEDQLEQLFKAERNSSTIGTEGEAGTGLGLLICKEFAELNEGEIRVQSKLGIGSCFKLFLPLV